MHCLIKMLILYSSNKPVTARDLLVRLQLAYENLPTYLQQNIMSWNKG